MNKQVIVYICDAYPESVRVRICITTTQLISGKDATQFFQGGKLYGSTAQFNSDEL